MAEGTYCDLISGTRKGDECTGLYVKVGADKKVEVELPHDKGERMLAFTIEVSRHQVEF